MYAWGIVFALLAGSVGQAGHICQKLAVNLVPDETGFFRRLLARPLWLAGLALELGAGTVFYLLAQVRLGPALVPGLMATGLITLAVGSAWIVREAPGLGELLGIGLLIASAVLLGGSRLAIDLRVFDILEAGFLARAAAFSAAVMVLFFALRLWAGARRGVKPASGGAKPTIHGVPAALASGLLYVLSNFWVGPFTASVASWGCRSGGCSPSARRCWC